MQIDLDNLEDLSTGSVFLATGGGGDPYVNYLLTKKILTERGPVPLIVPEELRDDAYVVSIGGLGAPSVSLEMLPSAEECVKTLKAFEAHTGRKLDAVAAVEVGGGNSLVPIIAASGMGLPIIDGDGMGRAFPESQMMTYSIGGVCPTPAVIVDYEGNISTFSAKSPYVYERQARSLAMTMGGTVIGAEHPMTGRELKDTIVAGTFSFAIELGRVLRECRGNAHDIILPLTALFSKSIYGEFHHLYSGKIVDCNTKTVGGYDVGTIEIHSFDKAEPPLNISIKNEFLTAFKGESLVACVPDLITLVDFETSAPLNAERARYGQRVAVYGIGSPQYYRTEKALDAVGPRCFGFDFDYLPIEKLVG